MFTIPASLRVLVVFGCLFGHFSYAGDRGQPRSVEYEIKAAFLCKFVKFCKWPNPVLQKRSSPIVVGIVGTDPFGTIADEAVDGLVVMGREFVIERYPTVAALDTCQILFVSADTATTPQTISFLRQHRPILTVSETSDFCENGGMISFFIDNNKVRFKINEKAARKAGIEISTRLLGIATVVNNE